MWWCPHPAWLGFGHSQPCIPITLVSIGFFHLWVIHMLGMERDYETDTRWDRVCGAARVAVPRVSSSWSVQSRFFLGWLPELRSAFWIDWEVMWFTHISLSVNGRAKYWVLSFLVGPFTYSGRGDPYIACLCPHIFISYACIVISLGVLALLPLLMFAITFHPTICIGDIHCLDSLEPPFLPCLQCHVHIPRFACLVVTPLWVLAFLSLLVSGLIHQINTCTGDKHSLGWLEHPFLLGFLCLVHISYSVIGRAKKVGFFLSWWVPSLTQDVMIPIWHVCVRAFPFHVHVLWSRLEFWHSCLLSFP